MAISVLLRGKTKRCGWICIGLMFIVSFFYHVKATSRLTSCLCKKKRYIGENHRLIQSHGQPFQVSPEEIELTGFATETVHKSIRSNVLTSRFLGQPDAREKKPVINHTMEPKGSIHVYHIPIPYTHIILCSYKHARQSNILREMIKSGQFL